MILDGILLILIIKNLCACLLLLIFIEYP